MTLRQRQALNLLLAFYALITLARAISHIAQPYGAGDLYVYWYAGHFVRERRNPYLAYLNDDAPTTPVTYVDGATFQSLPKPWIVPTAPPTNTTPYVLFGTILALFNWYIAKWAFFIINVVLAICVPPLAMRVVGVRWSRAECITAHLLFFASIGNRTTLVNSQNALMILLITLLVLAYSAQKTPRQLHSWMLGLLLGFALSKVSLIIAACLLLLLLRRYKPLIIGGAVQVVALIGMAAWTNGPPIETMVAHWQIFGMVAAFDGIHLGYLLPRAEPLIVAGSLILFGGLAWWTVKNRPNLANPLIQQHLFTTLALWSLLFAYHGPYDAVLLLPVYLYFVAHRLSRWQHATSVQRAFAATLLAGVIILLLPGNIDLAGYLTTPPIWPQLLPKLISAHMTMLLVWSIMLYGRLLK